MKLILAVSGQEVGIDGKSSSGRENHFRRWWRVNIHGKVVGMDYRSKLRFSGKIIYVIEFNRNGKCKGITESKGMVGIRAVEVVKGGGGGGGVVGGGRGGISDMTVADGFPYYETK